MDTTTAADIVLILFALIGVAAFLCFRSDAPERDNPYYGEGNQNDYGNRKSWRETERK
jgi:hypothetical protein